MSDENDVERFMRSPEGKADMESLTEALVGQTIDGLRFEQDYDRIVITLSLGSGETRSFDWTTVDAIRGEFEEVLKREYYVDYPERIQHV